MSFAEFFHMGGYAFYVWTSYGLAAVVLITNVVVAVMGGRRLRQDLAGKLRREKHQ
jgi:heme exporter protein D